MNVDSLTIVHESSVVILYTRPMSEISITPSAIERMRGILTDTSSSMVYSDYIGHTLEDYQQGSVRDDFDFGAVLLFPEDLFNSVIPDIPYYLSPLSTLYDIRLRLSLINDSFFHIREPLYSIREENMTSSQEKHFNYLDPRNEQVQKEFEFIFRNYLESIHACLPATAEGLPPFDTDFKYEASVIIPVFNRKRTISDAISSALSQKTNFLFNVIVVDNHSTDGISEIIDFSNERLVYLVPDRLDLGIGGCWNEALYNPLCGRFAVQLDSDDIYSDENSLQKIVDTFHREHCAMVVGSYLLTDFDLNPIPPGKIDHREWSEENGRNNLLRVNGIGAPRAFYTPILRKLGGFPNVSYGEDYAVALRVSRQFRIARIFDILYLCRRWKGNSDASLSNAQINKNNSYKDMLRSIEIKVRRQLKINDR